MKRILLISMLFFLFACSSKQTEELLVLPNPIELESIEYPNEFISSGPRIIKPIGGKLLLFNHNGRNENIPVLHVMDANTGEIIQEWGVYGNGPDECLSSEYWGSDDEKQLIWLFDMDQYILSEYHWDNTPEKIEFTLLRKIQAPRHNTNYWYGTGLKNGNFAAFAMLGPDRPLIMLNNQLDSIATFGDIPPLGTVNTEPKNFYRTYGTKFISLGNMFVAIMLNYGNISFYEQQSDNQVHKLWERYIEKPIYSEKSGQLDLSRLKDGFFSVAMNKKYIYVTYSGVRNCYETSQIKNGFVPQTILMFDHKGNLLYNFHTKDRRIGAIALSEDGKTIYAVTYEPEVAIVRFDISKYV